MRDFLTRARGVMIPIALLVLTTLNVAQLFDRPKPADANFSDSVLFDHREYYEIHVWEMFTSFNSTLNQMTSYPSVAYRAGGMTCDGGGNTGWGINNDANTVGFAWPTDTTGWHPGAGKTIWVGEVQQSDGTALGDPFAATGTTEDAASTVQTLVGTWSRLNILECIIAFDYVSSSPGGTGMTTAPSANTKAGFGLGFASVTNISATTANLCILYADNFQGTPRWSAYLNGTGASCPPVVLTGVDPPVANRMFRCRIVYNPIAKYAAFCINGIEGARITNASYFPAAGGGGTGLSCFAQSGSNAGASINAAFWYPTHRVYYRAP
jgi:hypothetical protein